MASCTSCILIRKPLSTGTFVQVTFLEILAPEFSHRHTNQLFKMGMVILGLIFISVIMYFLHDLPPADTCEHFLNNWEICRWQLRCRLKMQIRRELWQSEIKTGLVTSYLITRRINVYCSTEREKKELTNLDLKCSSYSELIWWGDMWTFGTFEKNNKNLEFFIIILTPNTSPLPNTYRI